MQFFQEKDIFIEEYRKQLAKRLLTPGGGERDEDERSMISKLKVNLKLCLFVLLILNFYQ